MAKVIANANQKGGTGKSTATVNLGVGLAALNKKVILLDADAQGNLTDSLGFSQPDNLSVSLATILTKVITEEPYELNEGILHHKEGVDLMPGNIELSAIDVSLVNTMSRETVLSSYINNIRENYDYALIDCMPSLGMLTINALAAADSVIIPVQAHYLPAKGMTQLLQTITRVKKQINPNLKVDGVLLTMVDNVPTLLKTFHLFCGGITGKSCVFSRQRFHYLSGQPKPVHRVKASMPTTRMELQQKPTVTLQRRCMTVAKSSARDSIRLTSVDELFTTETSRTDSQCEKVLDILLSDISDFPHHPFKVKVNEARAQRESRRGYY